MITMLSEKQVTTLEQNFGKIIEELLHGRDMIEVVHDVIPNIIYFAQRHECQSTVS